MGRLTNSCSNTCLLNDRSSHVVLCSFSRVRYSNRRQFRYKKLLCEEENRYIRARGINLGLDFAQINIEIR